MKYWRSSCWVGMVLAVVTIGFTVPVWAGQLEDFFRKIPGTGKPLDEQKVKELRGMKSTAGLDVRALQKQNPENLVGKWELEFLVNGFRGMGSVSAAFVLYPDRTFVMTITNDKLRGKWSIEKNQLVLAHDNGGNEVLDMLLTENFMILNLPGSDQVFFWRFSSNV